jgi:hypothetical protein
MPPLLPSFRRFTPRPQIFQLISAKLNPAMCLAQAIWGYGPRAQARASPPPLFQPLAVCPGVTAPLRSPACPHTAPSRTNPLRNITWLDFVVLSLAELAGAFFGAGMLWLHYFPHWCAAKQNNARARESKGCRPGEGAFATFLWNQTVRSSGTKEIGPVTKCPNGATPLICLGCTFKARSLVLRTRPFTTGLTCRERPPCICQMPASASDDPAFCALPAARPLSAPRPPAHTQRASTPAPPAPPTRGPAPAQAHAARASAGGRRGAHAAAPRRGGGGRAALRWLQHAQGSSRAWASGASRVKPGRFCAYLRRSLLDRASSAYVYDGTCRRQHGQAPHFLASLPPGARLQPAV